LEEYHQHAFFQIFLDVVDASFALEKGMGLLSSVAVDLVAVALFVYSLVVLPYLMLHAFIAYKRGPLMVRGMRCRLHALAGAVSFAALILLSYEVGNWAIDSIRPVAPVDPIISNVDSTRTGKKHESIAITFTITNPSADPITLRDGDFQMWLVVKLTEEEAKLRSADASEKKRLFLTRQRNQIMVIRYGTRILDTSQGRNRPTYLVSPGQRIWVHISTTTPLKPIKYAKDDLLHCAVVLGNFSIEPIVAYGMVSDEGSDIALTSKALTEENAPIERAPTKN
jgi:hypothetical protein